MILYLQYYKNMKKEERLAVEREQRRDRIVGCAETIFFDKGYQDVTIDEIAKKAGYTKRTIYFYFKDKEEIFLSVVYRAQRLFYAYLERAFEEHGNQTEAGRKVQSVLSSLGRFFYQYAQDHPGYVSMLMQYESMYHKYHAGKSVRDDQQGLCQNISIEYGELVKKGIETDMKHGLIQSDLSSNQLLLLLWGQVFGVMQVLLMRSDDFVGVYGITQKELYEHFLRAMETFLASV